MEAREGNHVDSQLPQVSVQLTRKPQAGGDTAHGERYKMVEISIGGCGEFESSEADIIESFVVNAHDIIGVLDELMDR